MSKHCDSIKLKVLNLSPCQTARPTYFCQGKLSWCFHIESSICMYGTNDSIMLISNQRLKHTWKDWLMPPQHLSLSVSMYLPRIIIDKTYFYSQSGYNLDYYLQICGAFLLTLTLVKKKYRYRTTENTHTA